MVKIAPVSADLLIKLALFGAAGFAVWYAIRTVRGSLPSLPSFAGARQAVSDAMDSAGLYLDREKAVAKMYGVEDADIGNPMAYPEPRAIREAAEMASERIPQYPNLSDIYAP